MNLLQRIFNFYINSSIHVAFAVVSLTVITLIQFDISTNENLLFFLFFATITGYNFVKFFGVAKFHHRSLASWLKVIQVFSLVSFIAMCYYASDLEYHSLVVLFVCGLITFLYAIPLLPMTYFRDSQMNLREISGLKIYLIALVWTVATVLLPLIENDIVLDSDVVITSIQRFIFIVVLMLPFEIRDLNYDSLKLATIPQKIGIKKTKASGVLLLIVFFVLDYFKNEGTSNSILSTLIIAFVTIILVMFSHKKQSKYYSAFWVESLPMVWLAILLVLC